MIVHDSPFLQQKTMGMVVGTGTIDQLASGFKIPVRDVGSPYDGGPPLERHLVRITAVVNLQTVDTNLTCDARGNQPVIKTFLL